MFRTALRQSSRAVAGSVQATARTRIAPSVVSKASRTYASEAKASPTEVSSILEQRIRGVQEEANLAETGRVLSVGYVSCFEKGFFLTTLLGTVLLVYTE